MSVDEALDVLNAALVEKMKRERASGGIKTGLQCGLVRKVPITVNIFEKDLQ